jgi:hypothetical protein
MLPARVASSRTRRAAAVAVGSSLAATGYHPRSDESLAGTDPPNRHEVVSSLLIRSRHERKPPDEVRTALVAEHHTRFANP